MFQSSIRSGRSASVFDATLDRMAKIGLAETRDPERLDVSQLPPPDLLARLLTEIASVWQRQRGEPARPGTAAIQGIDSPETLVSFAATNGIDVVFENRLVASLTAEDLPAVMLTHDGMGRMLRARRGRIFTAQHGGESYTIDKEALAAEEAGTLFLVRPRGIVPSHNIAEIVSDLASPESSDPVRGILDFMTSRHRGMLIELLIAAAFSNLMLLALPVYSGRFELLTRFKVPASTQPGLVNVPGKLRYQACNDRMCLPPKTVDLTLPVSVSR